MSARPSALLPGLLWDQVQSVGDPVERVGALVALACALRDASPDASAQRVVTELRAAVEPAELQTLADGLRAAALELQTRADDLAELHRALRPWARAAR